MGDRAETDEEQFFGLVEPDSLTLGEYLLLDSPKYEFLDVIDHKRGPGEHIEEGEIIAALNSILEVAIPNGRSHPIQIVTVDCNLLLIDKRQIVHETYGHLLSEPDVPEIVFGLFLVFGGLYCCLASLEDGVFDD